ncbi:MAG TPA: hypothetical protein VGN14_04675 [Candidatus Elarobacter sp.]|jgi:hypothetical protein
MRRIIAIVALLLVAWSSAGVARSSLAPADEYFGRMKMSVLGIRNALNGIERRAAEGDRNYAAMGGQLAWVDDAIRDWEAKYPHDTWLPRFHRARAHVAEMMGTAVVVRRY